MQLALLTDELVFPPAVRAVPEGLLAFGGDLSIERLLLAYRSGIFPWYSLGEPILWWSPDPRFVLLPAEFKVPKSLARVVRAGTFEVTFDNDFGAVIDGCRRIERPNQPGTWITPEMLEAYRALHAAGHAHSVEVHRDGELAGGLYGVTVGRCFCGESMFALQPNASKVGLVHLLGRLRERDCTLIDCQVHSPHLESFGARNVPRREFLALLAEALDTPGEAHDTCRQSNGAAEDAERRPE